MSHRVYRKVKSANLVREKTVCQLDCHSFRSELPLGVKKKLTMVTSRREKTGVREGNAVAGRPVAAW